MVSETITIEGHIIDSRTLSDALDDINRFGGDFEILEVHIGQRRRDRSHARLEVYADDAVGLAKIIASLRNRGAIVEDASDAEIVAADVDGALPDAFYCTTNQPTFVRHNGEWVEVRDQEMDCGIRHNDDGSFQCVPMQDVKKGDEIVCGLTGISVEPIERALERGTFQYLATEVATEKPKRAIIKHCAEEIRALKEAGKKIVFVGGGAVVHTDSVEHVVRMIDADVVDVLIASNSLAVHDIELALYGTSMGIYVEKAALSDTGHEHPIRATNTIRRAGGISRAVQNDILTEGVMHACVRKNVDFRVIGSVRDDAPLPDTITDTVAAQDEIRRLVHDAGFVVMVGSRNLSIATAFILPAATPVLAVDINPNVLHKIRDRGTMQTIGLVTDAESFLRELAEEVTTNDE